MQNFFEQHCIYAIMKLIIYLVYILQDNYEQYL